MPRDIRALSGESQFLVKVNSGSTGCATVETWSGQAVMGAARELIRQVAREQSAWR
jgi:hypothetical protein